MNNSIESLDVSTISESETEPDLVKEIIAPIYSTFTIQTPSSSQLVEEDFIPSAQFEEEIVLAPTQSQIFNKPLLLSLTTNNVRRGAPTKASQKRKAAVDIATQESPVKKIKKLKAITDSQSTEFINYVIPV